MNVNEAEELLTKIVSRFKSAKYTLDDSAEWADGLGELTFSDCVHALDAYCNDGKSHAPTFSDIKTRAMALSARKETGNDESAKFMLMSYLRQGLVPLVREHHGKIAYSMTSPERAAMFGSRRSMKLHGLLTEVYYEDIA